MLTLHIKHYHNMTTNDVYDDIDLSVAPMASEDVKERLASLEGYDEQIIRLLETASTAVKELQLGKKPSDEEEDKRDHKTEFDRASKEYFEILEHISVGLRKEIRLLHQASKEKVLPLSLAAKADTVGRHKEKELWNTIDKLLESKKKPVEDNNNHGDDPANTDADGDENMEGES